MAILNMQNWFEIYKMLKFNFTEKLDVIKISTA